MKFKVLLVNWWSLAPRWGYTSTKTERCEKIRMRAHYYFDWKGPRGTVKEYGEKLVKACEKTGAKFHGIYGPHQDKWNFVAVIEAEDTVECMKPFQEAGGMQENMPHFIVKYFSKTYP